MNKGETLLRYVDQNLPLHSAEDFVKRDRIPTVAQFIMLFAINYVVVIGAYLISASFLQFAVITVVMLGITDSVMVWTVQRSRDMVLVTEFQNALFASALSMNNHFCVITRKDGIVVYTDLGFRSMYPQFERSLHRTIDDIFQMGAVSQEDGAPVARLIANNTSGSGVITLRDGDGLTHKMMIYVDPIRRPHDYVLLRGRPYVEKRSPDTASA